MATVITANRLADGIVVFLGVSDWTTAIGEAVVLDAAAEAEAVARAKHDEDRHIVVESYPIEVADNAGAIVPRALREAIRARGPTVRSDLSTPNQR